MPLLAALSQQCVFAGCRHRAGWPSLKEPSVSRGLCAVVRRKRGIRGIRGIRGLFLVRWLVSDFVFDRQSLASRSDSRVRVGRSCALRPTAPRSIPSCIEPAFEHGSSAAFAADTSIFCDRLDHRRRSDQGYVLCAPPATSNCTPGPSLRPHQEAERPTSTVVSCEWQTPCDRVNE